MANISTYLTKIKQAVYGEEVRGSIHDALSAMNTESSSAMEFASTAKDSAANSAKAAKTSETNASASAAVSEQKASEASASASASKESEEKAKTSETKADVSAKAAKESETNAQNSQTAAERSNQEAIAQAQTATQQATAAAASADNARISENNAANSESAAKSSQTAAETAMNKAQTAADTATEKAFAADISAKSAETSANAASSSASEAKQSATNATESLSSALEAQTVAESARDDAQIFQTSASRSAAEASESAATAKEYSGNPPIIRDGNWWTWNAENKAYEDSGNKAVLNYDKTYASIDEMEADKGNQSVNTLAIISTDINVEDNAKLYIHNGTDWQYLADLSGFTGVGIQSIELTDGNHEHGTTDTYTITLTDGRNIEFPVYNGADGEGLGDMLASVYDKNNKKTDIFAYVDDKISDVQPVLTFDETPRYESKNPVYSGGVYTALTDKQDTLTGAQGQFVGFDSSGNAIAAEIPKIEVDTELNGDSENPVQNKIIYDAITELKSQLDGKWVEKETTFESDGSITEKQSNTETKTIFQNDGSITEELYIDGDLKTTKHIIFNGNIIKEVIL